MESFVVLASNLIVLYYSLYQGILIGYCIGQDFCLRIFGPQRRPQNIAKPTVFHVVLRDIGKSFQLAITTPRLDLIGYGNATAQS